MRRTANRLMLALLFSGLVSGLVAISSPTRAADPFKLKPGARGKVCIECHDGIAELLKKRYVHTPIAKGDCSGCHNPHTSNYDLLLSAETGEMCLQCHDDLVPAETQSSHQVFVEGKCISCHDPHAADTKQNLVRPGGELCFECHPDVRDKIAANQFQHEPVTDDCLECHNPHASAQSVKLLNNAQPALCADCHEVDKTLFKRQHKDYPVQKARCTACHDPHGSSNEGILYDNVHEPVAERKCHECHERANSPTPLALKETGYELCEGCHYDAVGDIFNQPRMHWPLVDTEGCINCHSPHASPVAGLLKEPMLDLCGECHSDTVARQERSQTKHPPIADGECTECHSPHSSENVFLLNEASVIDLCATCHEWQTHSSHPIGEKVIDPRNKNLQLQCSSCHRTHGTEYLHFIYFETINEQCVQCHTDLRR